jgi:hypothetical protein
MLGSKEHYEAIEMFEKVSKADAAFNTAFEKEDKSYWARGAVYKNGLTNFAFKAFLRGVAFGKTL